MENKTFVDQKELSFAIQEQLCLGMKKNPSFSLRAFAKKMDMDPSSLSQIINGKRKVSVKLAKSILLKIKADPQIYSKVLRSFSADSEESFSYENSYFDIQYDSFQIISDWIHFAILELTSVENFKYDIQWMAKKLSQHPVSVQSAIERLKRVGLIVEKNNSLQRTKSFVTNDNNGNYKDAHKELQRQLIQLALEAVDNTSHEHKDITSITMAIDPEKLSIARKEIDTFRRKLCQILETGKQKEVYNLGIQLFPLTKLKEK